MVDFIMNGWPNGPQRIFAPMVVAHLGTNQNNIVITYDTGAISDIILNQHDRTALGVTLNQDTFVRAGSLAAINGNPMVVNYREILADAQIDLGAFEPQTQLFVSGPTFGGPHGVMSIRYQMKLDSLVAILDIHGQPQRQINGLSEVGPPTHYPLDTTFYSTDIRFFPQEDEHLPNPPFRLLVLTVPQLKVAIHYQEEEIGWQTAVWDTGAGYNTIPLKLARKILNNNDIQDEEEVVIPLISLGAVDGNGLGIPFRIHNVPFVADVGFSDATLGAPIFALFEQMILVLNPTPVIQDPTIGIIAEPHELPPNIQVPDRSPSLPELP